MGETTWGAGEREERGEGSKGQNEDQHMNMRERKGERRKGEGRCKKGQEGGVREKRGTLEEGGNFFCQGMKP